MKTKKIVAFIPLLLVGTLLTSCAKVVGTSSDLSGVDAAINKVASQNYSQEVKTISYYEITESKEVFSTPEDYAEQDITNIGFRRVKNESFTRIDFSNPDDFYYYEFKKVTYNYYVGFDSKNGSTIVKPSSYFLATQFYKKPGENIYHIERINNRRIKGIDSLNLDNYPYLNKEALADVNTVIETGATTVSKEQGTLLFNEYFKKLAEHKYRINKDIVNSYEADLTKSYEYSADDKTFIISANKEVEFNVLTPKVVEYNEVGAPVYNSYEVNTLAPKTMKNDETEPKYNVEKNTWLELEDKTQSALRNVNLVYGKCGWLSQGSIDDERNLYDASTITDGSKEIILSYYLTADFNLKMPHSYGVIDE